MLAELRRILDHALRTRGEARLVADALGMDAAAWSRFIARLRSLGFATTVTVHDPRLSGRSCESVSLVKLRRLSLGTMDGFEEACRRDPAIYSAARISGRFDYQLASCHADPGQAERWRRRLADHPDIMSVEQSIVRTIMGHGLRQVPLSGLRPYVIGHILNPRPPRTSRLEESDRHV